MEKQSGQSSLKVGIDSAHLSLPLPLPQDENQKCRGAVRDVIPGPDAQEGAMNLSRNASSQGFPEPTHRFMRTRPFRQISESGLLENMNIQEHSCHFGKYYSFKGSPLIRICLSIVGTSSKQRSLNQAGQQTFSWMTYQGSGL